MKLKNYFLLLLVLTPLVVLAEDPGKVPDIFGQTYSDNTQIRYGKSEDFVCEYDTAQTPDAFICGTSADSNNFIISEKADINYDFAHALSTDPTLIIHSHNQSATQYIKIYHDGTNGVIDTGTGVVSFPNGISAASGAIGGGAGTFTSLDVTDGNITNVGTLAVDSVNADATSVDYNDVNLLELTQADLNSTCTLGQLRLDTGGSAKELCYCQATNTWLCTTLSAGPTD